MIDDDHPAQILVAEDNPADAHLIRMALRREDFPHRLHVCTDGEQALDWLARRGPYADAPRPDLIVLDLNLPRYDGREILMRLHGNHDLSHVPVAVFTSSDSPRDVEECTRFGAARYVTKPNDLQAFLGVGAILKELAMSHAAGHEARNGC